jgi:formiminotetrahydrofolate cyclodeaminase
MDLTKQIGSYLEEISSSSPTPGGGNVSAFCGALSCSLGIMACNLTIGKKKYLACEEDMKRISLQLEEAQKKLLILSEKDNEAFNAVMEAFKLPKETDEQKAERSRRIDEATFQAAQVPFEVMRVCAGALPSVEEIIEKGNQNSLSDAGVAGSLLNTAVTGAYYNVLINCSALNMEHENISGFKDSAEKLFLSITSECSQMSENLIKKLGSK